MKKLKIYQIIAMIVLSVSTLACSEDNQPVNLKAEVTDFSPLEGGLNTLLTLRGEGFGNDINRVQVTINGKPATVKSVENNTITAEVQKGTSSGLVRVILDERPNAQVLIYDLAFTYISKHIVSTYIGGNGRGETDGALSVATLSKPRFLKWSENGTLYFVEDGGTSENDMACIRMLKEGNVSTLLKAAKSPLVQRIRAIAFSTNSEVMYIANDNDAKGTMGFGSMQNKGDDSYIDLTSLWTQSGVTFTTVNPLNGAVYVGVHSGSWIYQYDGESFIPKIQLPDGNGTAASKGNINGMAWNKEGTVAYIVSRKNHVIYKADYDAATGDFSNVVLLAGSFGITGYADGMGTSAKFNEPCQADVDMDGNLYVADRNNHCIRVITPEGDVSTYAGKNKAGMVNGIASEAEFNNPEGCQFGSDGALYVADYSNHAIRKIEEGVSD